MKILIIDDDQLELFIALKLLRMEYQAEGFKTLSDTLQWAQTNEFDLLISDNYISSTVRAEDVLKAIMEVKPKSYKAVVLTNFMDEPTLSRVKAAGFDGVIEKPLTLEKLKAALS
ncbi:MAG TPA: response regulator [Cyclobacteriaceae bacterium]